MKKKQNTGAMGALRKELEQCRSKMHRQADEAKKEVERKELQRRAVFEECRDLRRCMEAMQEDMAEAKAQLDCAMDGTIISILFALGQYEVTLPRVDVEAVLERSQLVVDITEDNKLHLSVATRAPKEQVMS